MRGINMNCDICGKEATLYKTDIEGSFLNLCQECAKMGDVMGEIKPLPTRKEIKKMKKEEAEPQFIDENREIIQVITEDYANIIQRGREKKGLKQKDFARMIAEKESLVHTIESGKHKPSMPLARKLEKALNIKLVEQHEEKHGKLIKTGSGPLTIGDIIKTKKRN